MSGFFYRFWERFISNEERATDVDEIHDDNSRIGKWWPITYPESERTEIMSPSEWRRLKAREEKE